MIGRRAAPAAGIAAMLMLLAVVPPARAAVRESTVGNYYFQDDATGSRERIVVDAGDQIRFTVREAGFSPHNIRIDEFGVRSPDLQLFDTYTTPALDRAGTYRLYCSRHEDNPGQPHVAALVVRAASPPPTTSPAPQPPASSPTPSGPGDSTGSKGGAAAGGSEPAAGPAVAGAAAAPELEAPDGEAPPTTVAVGLGRSADRTRPPPADGSLAAILGRRPAPGPWTRALSLASAALALMAALATAAAVRGRRAGS